MLSVKYLFVFSLAIILTDGGVSMHDPFYCYSQDPLRPQIGMLSAISAYEISRGRSINPNVSTCIPSKFWMFTRHGTRLPLAEELTLIFEHSERLFKEILSNYEKGRTSLCASDIELIRNWRFDPNITDEAALDLTSSGWNELQGLAQRYQTAFPSIFPSTYSSSDIFFRTSDTQRTQESLRAFADGLYGVNGHEQVQFEDIPQPDYFLQPALHCPLFSQATAIHHEQDEFRELPEFQLMASQVSAKLGFHGSHALRNIEIETLYLICTYEQIWHLNSTSPFCAGFSVANHQVFEYSLDLRYYYVIGYGQPNYRRLFENLNCFLMQDMLRFLQSNDINEHKARIFSSSITQLLLIVSLGAFEDDVLMTRHNFAQQVERLWKSSVIAPKAANLAVIRYDCADGDNDVLFLYNEKPLQIPGCQPNGLCKQSLVIEKYRRFLDADCMQLFCTNSYVLNMDG